MRNGWEIKPIKEYTPRNYKRDSILWDLEDDYDIGKRKDIKSMIVDDVAYIEEMYDECLGGDHHQYFKMIEWSESFSDYAFGCKRKVNRLRRQYRNKYPKLLED